MRPDPRAGFTVLELMVALLVSGLVLLGARQMLEVVTDRADAIAAAAADSDREANAERVLRTLFARLEVGTSPDAEFGGTERVVQFSTWCDTPAGWLTRCRVRVAIDTVAGEPALVATLSTGERLVLRRGFRGGVLRYLNDAANGGSWFRGWGAGITTPPAVGIILDRDTIIVRIGERG